MSDFFKKYRVSGVSPRISFWREKKFFDIILTNIDNPFDYKIKSIPSVHFCPEEFRIGRIIINP